MFKYIQNLKKKRIIEKRRVYLPSVAKRHNEIVMNIYKLLSSGNYNLSIRTALEWIESFPKTEEDIKYESWLASLSGDRLLEAFSRNYSADKPDKGISEGERQRIQRLHSYLRPKGHMNGRDLIYLMLGICYYNLGNYSESLKWKSHSLKVAGFYQDNVKSTAETVTDAELWRIIELSTISDLEHLNKFEEIKYLKSWINEGDLCHVYMKLDHSVAETLNILDEYKYYKAEINFKDGFYQIYTKKGGFYQFYTKKVQLIRRFDLKGLNDIVSCMIHLIESDPSVTAGGWNYDFDNMDIPQMNP